MILYEYPFNERIRTYLRLEALFGRLSQLMGRTDPVDHHFALSTIFEVMDVGVRADLKSDVMKDLERQKATLAAYRGNPAISEAALDQITERLDRCFSALHALAGKPGQDLLDNDWLMSLRSRIGIPGGTCEFDLPAYYAWQHRDAASRQADLVRWTSSLAPLAEALRVLLQLLRETGTPQKVMAVSGQFQQALPQGRTFQLMRLRIDPTLNLVPEISGNRLMVSVRLMQPQDDQRLVASTSDTGFEMTLCA